MIRSAQTLRDQATRLLEEAERIDSQPKDDFPDETVLLFRRSYGTAKLYLYAALKVCGRWYLTGLEQHALTWDALYHTQLQLADEVWVASEWTEEHL